MTVTSNGLKPFLFGFFHSLKLILSRLVLFLTVLLKHFPHSLKVSLTYFKCTYSTCHISILLVPYDPFYSRSPFPWPLFDIVFVPPVSYMFHYVWKPRHCVTKIASLNPLIIYSIVLILLAYSLMGLSFIGNSFSEIGAELHPRMRT